MDKVKAERGFRQIAHILGFSCIGGAIFLQLLVFTDIVFQGYFLAVERNQLILVLEISLTFFALAYFLYMYRNLLRTL